MGQVGCRVRKVRLWFGFFGAERPHRPKSLWLPTFRNPVTPGVTRGPAFLIYRQWSERGKAAGFTSWLIAIAVRCMQASRRISRRAFTSTGAAKVRTFARAMGWVGSCGPSGRRFCKLHRARKTPQALASSMEVRPDRTRQPRLAGYVRLAGLIQKSGTPDQVRGDD